MSGHFRKLENMYRAAPVNAYYSPKLEVSNGRAVITMLKSNHTVEAIWRAAMHKARHSEGASVGGE